MGEEISAREIRKRRLLTGGEYEIRASLLAVRNPNPGSPVHAVISAARRSCVK
jgi:hypothetical protein